MTVQFIEEKEQKKELNENMRYTAQLEELVLEYERMIVENVETIKDLHQRVY